MVDLQHFILEQLGITPWVLRRSEDQALVEPMSLDVSKKLQCLAEEVAHCKRCDLYQSRTQTVFARGNPHSRLMIIGEAPGFHEDKQGLPFVGKAGGLLNRMIKSIGLAPEDVYVANVLKCRPPENRDPLPEEIQQCSGYLTQQINLVRPKLILAVGRFAGQFLLNQVLPLAKMRNTLHSFQGKPVIISYHPAYLLRNPRDKKKAFLDLMKIKEMLNDTHPA